ncbi:hypothetical protein Tco_0214076 [Tanacetum coccineum]
MQRSHTCVDRSPIESREVNERLEYLLFMSLCTDVLLSVIVTDALRGRRDDEMRVARCQSLSQIKRYSLDHFVEIPSGESKVHIDVLSVFWGNRLPIPDGSLPLSR